MAARFHASRSHASEIATTAANTFFVHEIRKFRLNCRETATLDASYRRHNLIKGMFYGGTGWTERGPVAILLSVGFSRKGLPRQGYRLTRMSYMQVTGAVSALCAFLCAGAVSAAGDGPPARRNHRVRSGHRRAGHNVRDAALGRDPESAIAPGGSLRRRDVRHQHLHQCRQPERRRTSSSRCRRRESSRNSPTRRALISARSRATIRHSIS